MAVLCPKCERVASDDQKFCGFCGVEFGLHDAVEPADLRQFDSSTRPSPQLTGDSNSQASSQLGAGYRVIRGVAGSGKTVALLRRVRAVAANNPNGTYLLVCFNNALAKSFDVKMVERPNVSTSTCLLYTSPSPRDGLLSRMPSSA